MKKDLLQLDITKLSQSVSDESSTISKKEDIKKPALAISKVFKNYHDFKEIQISNKNIQPRTETIINCSLTREKVAITIKTSLKLIEFIYIVSSKKCFFKDKEATNKQFNYFIKAMNEIIKLCENKTISIIAIK